MVRFETNEDSEEIKNLISKGKFCIVENVNVYCDFTDDYIGNYPSLVEVFDDRKEAEKFLANIAESFKSNKINFYIMPSKDNSVEEYNKFHNSNYDYVPF